MAEDSPGEGITKGTVKLPIVGRAKRAYVIGGALVVGVAAIIWWRRRQAAQDSTAAAGTITTDSAGNVGVIDPATGFVYGSAEDENALEALGATSTVDTTDSGDSSGSAGGSSDVGTQVNAGPPFTNNAAWAQYVSAYLTGTVGMDPATVATDLGKYLAGEQVTQAERDQVIEPAITYGLPPPVAGANGFPPSVNVVGSTSGTTGTPSAPALALGTATDTSAVVKWTPVTGATGYAWTASGSGFSKSGTTSGTSVTLSGLSASSSYTVTVHATNAAGAGPSSSITAKTKAAGTSTSGSYAEVTVVEYHSPPAWNATISGIAQHYGYGSDWESVWNDPRNAGLRGKRGQAQDIRAGDTVWVKRK